MSTGSVKQQKNVLPITLHLAIASCQIQVIFTEKEGYKTVTVGSVWNIFLLRMRNVTLFFV